MTKYNGSLSYVFYGVFLSLIFISEGLFIHSGLKELRKHTCIREIYELNHVLHSYCLLYKCHVMNLVMRFKPSIEIFKLIIVSFISVNDLFLHTVVAR